MREEIVDILLASMLVYCQMNLYGMVVISKYSLKKTMLFCNVVTTILIIAFSVEVFVLGVDRAMSFMFITFTIPSIFCERWLSKYKGRRFWFTFFFCDFFISAVEFSASVFGGLLGFKEYSIQVVSLELAAMILATIILIFFIRKPIKELLLEPQMNWVTMALFVFFLEALMYFISSYPTTIQIRPDDYLSSLIILIIELFVAVIFVFNLKKLQTAIQKQMEAANMVEEFKQNFTYMNQRYRILENNMDRIRQIKHDMKHHLRVIQKYTEDSDIKECKEYIATLVKEVDIQELREYCSCKVVNVTVAWFEQLAKKEKITFSLSGNIPEVKEQYDSLLTAIISNMLQNALEACENLVQRISNNKISPYIAMDCRMKGNALHIQCRNSCDGNLKVIDGTVCSRKSEEGHGIGLRSIQTAAESQNGFVRYQIKENEFRIDVILMDIIENG